MNQALASIGPVALGILLACAAWQDCASLRIPNRLTGLGLGLGLALNVVLPPGAGLIGPAPGALGLGAALAGVGVGLAVMLPLYMIGAMGAGDAKLMAMVGAFGGPVALLPIIVIVFLCGALLAILLAWRRKKLNLLIGNCIFMLKTLFIACRTRSLSRVAPPALSVGDIPYALAIFAGTLFYMLVRQTTSLL